MEQRSVVTQATRHFFTEDVSPDNHPVVDLQRRGVWIGLALGLQALDAIDHNHYMPYLVPFGSLIPFALLVGSFIAMAMAFRPGGPKKQAQAEHPRRWQRNVLLLTFIPAVAGVIFCGITVAMCFLPPQFSNDGTSLDTNAAMLLLESRNPYSDSNMLDIARHFSIQPNWTTPLEQGQFANRLDYPTQAELQAVLNTDLKTGTAPEFESKVSYPSLSFLTLVPFALFKDYNVLPFYLLSYVLLIIIAWRAARPEMRIWVLLLAMANVSMWMSAMGASLDIFYTLLIVIVWLLRDKRWISAVFLGLALASKQIAWFFIPFYTIMVFRQYGTKEVAYRLVIAGSIGLVFNLPFILWNAHAWLAGILAPVEGPMFPAGDGLINLSVTHLLPFFPKWVYSLLEGVTMIASLTWYWRICKKVPEAAMLLAVLPLFFAWRSLSSYFCCAAFPLFILMAAKVPVSKKLPTKETANRITALLPSTLIHAAVPRTAIPER